MPTKKKQSPKESLKSQVLHSLKNTNRWQLLLTLILIIFSLPYLEHGYKILLLPSTHDVAKYFVDNTGIWTSHFAYLRAFPKLAFAWLPGVSIFVLVVHLGEKAYSRNRKYLLIGLFIFLLFPILYNELVYRLLLKDYVLWLDGSLLPTIFSIEGLKNYFTKMFLFGYWPWTTSLVGLLLLFKKFTPNKPATLDKPTKITLAFFYLFIIILPLGVSSFMLAKSKMFDTGKQSTQKQVSFHILEPSYLPQFYVQEFKYGLKNDSHGRQIVRSAYDIDMYRLPSLDMYQSGNLGGLINVYQYPPTDLSYTDFLPLPATASAKIIDLASKQKATIQNFNTLNALTFQSENKSIINIISYNQPDSELIKIAESLR